MRSVRILFVLSLLLLLLFGCSPVVPPGGEGVEVTQEGTAGCGQAGGEPCPSEPQGQDSKEAASGNEPAPEAKGEPQKEPVGTDASQEPVVPEPGSEPGPEPAVQDASDGSIPESQPNEQPIGKDEPSPPEMGPEKVLPPLPTKPYVISFGYGSVFVVSRGLAVDSQGAVYVYGSFLGKASFGSTSFSSAGGSFEVFLSKFSSDGNLVWVKATQGNGMKDGFRVHIDSSDNIYVAGNFLDKMSWGGTTLDATKGGAFLTKFSTAGKVLWNIQMGNQGAILKSIRTDPQGQLFIAGQFSGPAKFGTLSFTGKADLDIFVARLNPKGEFQWMTSGGGPSIDIAVDLCLSPQNDIYLVGQIFDSSVWGKTTLTTTQDDLFVVKWDSKGSLQWVIQTKGQGSTIPHALRWTPQGQIFLSTELEGQKKIGSFSIPNTNHGTMTTLIFDTSGKIKKSSYSTGSTHIHPTSVAFDSKGRIYVGGEFNGSFQIDKLQLTTGNLFHAYVTRMSLNQVYDWSTLSKGKGTAAGRLIAIDHQDNLYLLGEFENDVVFDGTTLKRQPNAVGKEFFLWKLRPPK